MPRQGSLVRGEALAGHRFLGLLILLGLLFVGLDFLSHLIADFRVDLLGFIGQTSGFLLFALSRLLDCLFGQIVGFLVLGALLVLVGHLILSAFVMILSSTRTD